MSQPASPERRVLVLGAGRVSRPVVRYFLGRAGYRVTAGSLYVEDAEALIEQHPRGIARSVDVCDNTQVDGLVADADLVVSLVPFQLHVAVARIALRHRVPVVTTSYVSREMRALDSEARRAGVLLLNEVGLDPGLDHMSAMRVIDAVRATGGTIRAFSSCTGGLPSPEAANNPWRYKFSWSPRGALIAGTYAARFLRQGRVHYVPGPDLFDHYWPYDVEEVGRFEMYPNRDSLRYADTYGLARSHRDAARNDPLPRLVSDDEGNRGSRPARSGDAELARAGDLRGHAGRRAARRNRRTAPATGAVVEQRRRRRPDHAPGVGRPALRRAAAARRGGAARPAGRSFRTPHELRRRRAGHGADAP